MKIEVREKKKVFKPYQLVLEVSDAIEDETLKHILGKLKESTYSAIEAFGLPIAPANLIEEQRLISSILTEINSLNP